MNQQSQDQHLLQLIKYQLFDTDFVMTLDQTFCVHDVFGKLFDKYKISKNLFIKKSFIALSNVKLDELNYSINEHKIAMIDWTLPWKQKEIYFQTAIIKEDLYEGIAYIAQTREITILKKYEKVLKETLSQYTSVANILTSGIAILDVIYSENQKPTDYVFSFVNKAFCNMTNFDSRFVLNKRLSEVLSTSMDFWHEKYNQVVINKDQLTFDRFSPSTNRWYSNTIMFQEPNQIILMLVDITDRIALLDRYEIEKKRLSRVIDSSIDIIFEIGNDMRYVWAAGKGLTKIGKRAEEYIGKTVTEVFGEEGNDRNRYYMRSLRGEECSYTWHYSTDKDTFVFASTISPIILDDGSIIGAVGIARDITEQHIKQSEIEYLSFHDQLTNIYNRRFYESELKRINQQDFLPLTLTVIDVNGLKLVNDAFGHESGDIVLVKTAQVLTNHLRNQDFVGRIGGDEFVILMPKTTEEDAKLILRQINRKLGEEQIKSLPLSISYGMHTRKTLDEDLSDVFRIAEDNMYGQKLYESAKMKANAINIIMKTLFEKNDREEKHCNRVSELCVKIATKMKLNNSDIEKIKKAGLLHDIGKIVIDANILNKPNELNEHEWAEMRRHPDVGYRILNSITEFSPLANIILSHHERWDGTGYPRRLSGEEIPIFSRIMAVADAFDAMTMERPYRYTKSTEEALIELIEKKGSQFDPKVVDVFLQMIEESKDPGLTDIKRFERLAEQIKSISSNKQPLFPKRDMNDSSIEQFLKDHGFSGYTMTFSDDKILYFGYHAYIPLRQMEIYETSLPWRILQPYTIGEIPYHSAGVFVGGVIGTTNPRGSGVIYQNISSKTIIINSKHTYGYQGDLWGCNRYGILHLSKDGRIINRLAGDVLSTGTMITLEPHEYVITLFEADRIALGGPTECYAVSSHFEKGKTCKIEFHEKLIYHGE